ncbi:MAG: serine hydroxymethyltransferase [Bacilli bacterium]
MKEEIFELIQKESRRQANTIELIASENFVSNDVLKAQGSILTNKYAEGYPKNRYYGGCEFIDEIETMAINSAKALFNVKFANVQPHSGTSANMAVYRALLNKEDKVLGMDLDSGGHLSHGSSMSFSGMDYNFISYMVEKETCQINYDEVRKIALRERPKLIVAGASSYSRKIDFAEFRDIADSCGALLMVDMAHIAGLVAAGLHQNPCKYAHVVTATTHKTLRGPRGGIILTNSEELIKKINSSVFPGMQGGPLMHVIAAKAVCFSEALEQSFVNYQKQVIKNAKILCDVLKMEEFKIVTNGTDNHIVLVDVKKSLNMTGKEAESILESIGITCNKNMIPFDTTTPFITSGIRLGVSAMTTRGFKENEFMEVGKIISKCLKNFDDKVLMESLKEKTRKLCEKFRVYN